MHDDAMALVDRRTLALQEGDFSTFAVTVGPTEVTP
jgi:hypothetical protein